MERGLPAGSDGDVFGAHLPAKFGAQEFGQSGEDGGVAARGIVDRQCAAERGGIGKDFVEALIPDRLHLGNVRGVSAAEHERSRAAA